MRKVLSVFLSLFLILVALGCNNTPESASGALTVNVSDSVPKTIAFDPSSSSLGLTHYTVEIYDSENDLVRETTSYLSLSDGSGQFIATELVRDTYRVDVTGYLREGETYHEIATGTASADLRPGVDTDVNVVIDSFVDTLGEAITVNVTMPNDAIVNNAVSGTLTYTITPIEDGSATTGNVTLTNTALTDGVYTLTIDDALTGGRYLLNLSLASNGNTYSNADALVVYPGLPSTGAISLDSANVFDGALTITDSIGEDLTVSASGALESADGRITLTLDSSLAGYDKLWFVDGATVNPSVSGQSYSFTLEGGRHVVTVLVWDEAEKTTLGSWTGIVEVETDMVIEEKSPFTFKLNENGQSYTVTGLADGGGYIQPDPIQFVIPSHYNGLPVTEIGQSAFSGCSGLTGNLIIPDSVTSIRTRSFFGCSGFTGDLIIPDGITSIEDYAFYDCSGFTGNLVISDGVTSIGSFAFRNCSGFTGELVISDNVTSIGSSAFDGCSGFTGDLIIPDSVIYIGSSAFNACSGFTGDLVVPDSVTSIGSSAFRGCGGFTGNLVIPDSVTSIRSNTFRGCGGFTGNLVIPDGVTSIEDYAFQGCAGFTGELVIPDNVTSIEYYAFNGCSGFTGDLIIPDSVISIGYNAFRGCSGLDNFYIPKSIIEITGVFDYYPAFPDTASHIYCEAPSRPEGWTQYWFDGDEATQVFWGVSKADYDSITAGTFDVAKPVITIADDVTITSDTAFAHIYYTLDGSEPTKDNGTLYEGPFAADNGVTVKAVAYVGNETYSEVVEETVQSMFVFELNEDGQSYTVTGLTAEGLQNCIDTSSMSIPNEYNGLLVTAIADNAFYDLGAILTGDLYIPSNVKQIGFYAFNEASFSCDWHGLLLEGGRPLRELQCLSLAEQQGCPSRDGI